MIDHNGRLIGIVTEAQLVPASPNGGGRHSEPGPSWHECSAAEVMARPAAVACPGTSLIDLGTRMLSTRTSSIPIVMGDELVGIVTRGDLLRAAAKDARSRTAPRDEDLDEPAPEP